MIPASVSWQRRIGRQLLAWGGLNIALGLCLWWGSPLWQGIGLQAAVWGAVNILIALWGQRSLQRKLASLSDPVSLQRETARVRRLLLINAGLDVVYVLAGVTVILTLGPGGAFALGNGWGIVIQGGFLLFFDLWHGLRSPRSGIEEGRAQR